MSDNQALLLKQQLLEELWDEIGSLNGKELDEHLAGLGLTPDSLLQDYAKAFDAACTAQKRARLGPVRRLATVVVRALRSVSACALPRPSAIASAKLAKTTVNQSQSETARMKPAGASPLPTSAWTKSPVVRTLPTSTTNMTGFLTW